MVVRDRLGETQGGRHEKAQNCPLDLVPSRYRLYGKKLGYGRFILKAKKWV